MLIISYLTGLAIAVGGVARVLIFIEIEILFIYIISFILSSLGVVMGAAHTSTVDTPG